MRKNQDMFLIGEAIVCFMEMITLGIFLFALFTRKDVGLNDHSDLFQKSDDSEIPIKINSDDLEVNSFISLPENAVIAD
jgi:hypothetical protein